MICGFFHAPILFAPIALESPPATGRYLMSVSTQGDRSMGNCCLERPRRGGGGRAGAVHYARKNPVWVENNEVGERKQEARKGEGAGAPAAATEVKIRITRKQLEELRRRVEDGKHGGGGGGGAPVQEVISELLCVASTSSNFRHREEEQWRPSLQTIPE